ncbi:hypothetical protein EDD15DRAFT_2520444 [Pisolithus albus]|nr:hypothetical protein EDD15DRAFT_2520444 [Pisolithus albus]
MTSLEGATHFDVNGFQQGQFLGFLSSRCNLDGEIVTEPLVGVWFFCHKKAYFSKYGSLSKAAGLTHTVQVVNPELRPCHVGCRQLFTATIGVLSFTSSLRLYQLSNSDSGIESEAVRRPAEPEHSDLNLLVDVLVLEILFNATHVFAARDLVNHLAEIHVYFGDLLAFLDGFCQSCIELPSSHAQDHTANDFLHIQLAATPKASEPKTKSIHQNRSTITWKFPMVDVTQAGSDSIRNTERYQVVELKLQYCIKTFWY